MNIIFAKGSLRPQIWKVSMIRCAIFGVLLSLFSLAFTKTAISESLPNTWKELLEKRSSLIFTESVDIGGLRVGGRGKIMFIWLDRSLIRLSIREAEGEVSDSITNGLEYYFSKKKEVKKLIKNRDVFLLTYQAIKRWDFKIEEIVINGYRLTVDDILTAPHYRVLGEIMPLKQRERLAREMFTEDFDDIGDYELYVAVPSMPKSGKVRISYGDDTVEWEIPKK